MPLNRTEQKPNVLWLMTDEQRHDSCGFNGSSWARTPVLDKLAEHAFVFDNAYTPSPVCMPCRLTLLSGKRPSETGIWENEGAPEVKVDSLLEPFRNMGYRTATFGKQHYGGKDPVFETEESYVIPESVNCYDYNPPYQRSDYHGIKFRSKWLLGGKFPESVENKREMQAVERAREWLKESPEEPFFLRLSFSAPHTPVVPPSPFDTLIPIEEIPLPLAGVRQAPDTPQWLQRRRSEDGIHYLTQKEITRIRQLYYGEAAFADYAFGKLLSWMETQGLLDNTIIVFISDHGTHLGEQGIVQKRTFFEQSVKVPFFIRLPNESETACSRHIKKPVETTTLIPTLLELCGLPLPQRQHTRSLANALLKGLEIANTPIISQIAYGMDRMVMVRHKNLKLISNVDDTDEINMLFNLENDPSEQHNLHREYSYQNKLAELKGYMEKALNGTEKIQPLVKVLHSFDYSERGNVICPTCKQKDKTRSATDPKWTTEFKKPHICNHCGQKFALEKE